MDTIKQLEETATGSDRFKSELLRMLSDELRKRDEEIERLRAALSNPETLMYLFNALLNDEKLGREFVRLIPSKIERWRNVVEFEARMKTRIAPYPRDKAVSVHHKGQIDIAVPAEPMLENHNRFYKGDVEITEAEYRNAEAAFMANNQPKG